MEKNNKKSIVNSEAYPGILLLASTILALILANTQLDKFYNYILYDLKNNWYYNIKNYSILFIKT